MMAAIPRQHSHAAPTRVRNEEVVHGVVLLGHEVRGFMKDRASDFLIVHTSLPKDLGETRSSPNSREAQGSGVVLSGGDVHVESGMDALCRISHNEHHGIIQSGGDGRSRRQAGGRGDDLRVSTLRQQGNVEMPQRTVDRLRLIAGQTPNCCQVEYPDGVIDGSGGILHTVCPFFACST